MPVSWSALSTPFDNLAAVTAVIQVGARIIIGPNNSLDCNPGGATIYTSDDDGITWDARPSPFDIAAACSAEVTGFAYSPALDRLVAVGTDFFGTTAICYSDDQGDTWTSAGYAPPVGGAVVCVARDDSQGLFVAGTSSEANNIHTSPDGITWTPRSTPWNGSGKFVASICYAGGTIGLWVAVGKGPTTKSAMTAADPTSTWTEVASGPFDSAGLSVGGQSVAFDGTVLAALGNSGTLPNTVSISTDAATWVGQTTDLDGDSAQGLAASSTLILAGGAGGIVESDDHGATWTSVAGPLIGSPGCLAISIGTSYSVATGRNAFPGDITAAKTPSTGPPPLLTPQGVCFAPDADTFDPNPEWVRLDEHTDVKIKSWEIDRGRNDEKDKTKTGTATVTMLDFGGILDPTNPTGPYFGNLDPSKQAAIALWNPITETWHTRFRGFVSDWNYDMDISEKYATVTLNLEDAFGPLSALEMTPGNQGDTLPSESEGDLYFAGGLPPDEAARLGAVSVFKHVNQRIIQALADAGWSALMQVVFSGNTTVMGAIYARRDQLLAVLFDAADAEFPGVANIFPDREGIITFHGRFARFNPERPGYGILSWPVGDGTAAAADASVALISGLSYRRSKDDIINACIALPQYVDDADVPGALVVDLGSIATHGWRSLSFDNLLTYQGHDELGVTLDAVTETKRFADYYVGNYAQPRTRVNVLRFRPVRRASISAPANWALHCGVDIGHLIPLKTTHWGGSSSGKVLKADCSAAEAYVNFGFSVPPTEVWKTVRMGYDSAASAFWSGDTSGYMLWFGNYLGGNDAAAFVNNGQWVLHTGGGPQDFPAALTPDVWHVVEFHYVDDGTTELYVDGSLVSTHTSSSLDDPPSLAVGLYGGGAPLDNDPAAIVYFDYVKAGATRGSSDYFSDDFEDGTLDAWTHAVGDVSVIDDPFAVSRGGFDEDFYVEGIRQSCVPMSENEEHEVTTELDVSPRSFFSYNPFGDVPDNDDLVGAFNLPGEDGTTSGNSTGFSNEDDDPVAGTSKDPIVYTFASLFTGPGGDYSEEATDTHNFYTAWYKWTAPPEWSASSSFGVVLSGQSRVSALLMLKAGVSGVPPDNGDFTALGTGGVVNTPLNTDDLSETETGDANIAAGDTILIGVGSMETADGESFNLTWAYTP